MDRKTNNDTWWEKLIYFALTLAIIVPFHIFVSKPIAHLVFAPARSLLGLPQNGSRGPG